MFCTCSKLKQIDLSWNKLTWVETKWLESSIWPATYMIIGNLRNYHCNCKENITLKLNFALSWVSCDYSMLITLYKIGGVHFCLLGTDGFHVKAKNERFTAASSRCHYNLKYENFTSSFGRLRQNIAPKSVPHVQHDYFSSFNQSNHWFVALSLTLPSSNLKLPNISVILLWFIRRWEVSFSRNCIVAWVGKRNTKFWHQTSQ